MPDNKEQNQLKELLEKLDGEQLEQVSLILGETLHAMHSATQSKGIVTKIIPGDPDYKQFAVDAISEHSGDSPYQFMKNFGEKLKGADEMSRFKKMLVVKDEAGIFGETPLHRAARNGRTEIALALIEKGADVNAAGETKRDKDDKPKINENVKEVFEGLSNITSESKGRFRLFGGGEGDKASSSRSIIKEAIRKVDQDAAPKIGPVGQ